MTVVARVGPALVTCASHSFHTNTFRFCFTDITTTVTKVLARVSIIISHTISEANTSAA